MKETPPSSNEEHPAAKLLIIQFGNYAEAEHRFAQGGGETYYAQRYTVDFVARLARADRRVHVLALDEESPFERLSSGVEASGMRLYRGKWRRPRTHELIGRAEAWGPTHLILQAPLAEVLRWSLRRGVETLPLFADSFRAEGFRQRIRYRGLSSVLNRRAIRWVANHGINAASDLVRIGVDPGKVLPFDWPAFLSPAQLASKAAPLNPSKVRLAYVGQVTASKGVGDLIEALALARSAGALYRATITGKGEIAHFRTLAEHLGVSAQLEFTGPLPHERAMRLMNEGDVVIVPSRPEYPEGMPMTIYEGLASRTPVVVSDHPMFVGRIIDRKSGMVFRAGNPQSLYEAVAQLVGDRALYERLSQEADQICENFFFPLKWDQVVSHWLGATPEDDDWLRRFALAKGGAVIDNAGSY